MNDADIERCILLLVGGQSEDTIGKYFLKQGRAADETRQIIEEAAVKLASYSRFSKPLERAKMLRQYEKMFLETPDAKTKVQILKELSKLRKLNEPDEPTEGAATAEQVDEMERSLALIRGYIAPLKLVDDGLPLEEHVRVASEICRREKLRQVASEKRPG